MALLITFRNPHRQDEVLENAYLKVSDFFEVNAAMKTIFFGFKVFYSVEDRDGDSPARPIYEDNVFVSGDDYDTFFAESVLKQDGNSLKTQAYSYLKSTEKYAGAEDC